MPTVDLEVTTLREFNQMLHDLGEGTNDTYFRVVNPRGRHAIAAGVDADVTVGSAPDRHRPRGTRPPPLSNGLGCIVAELAEPVVG